MSGTGRGAGTRTVIGAVTGAGDVDENGEESGGGRESGSLRNDSTGGSKDAIERVTPSSNQQSQPEGPTP